MPDGRATSNHTATLIVGSSSTTCSACGGNADMGERSHIHGGPHSMWVEGSSLTHENGCRAEFTAVQYVCHPVHRRALIDADV